MNEMLELVKTTDGTGLAARNAPSGTNRLHMAYSATPGPATDYSYPDPVYVPGEKIPIPKSGAHTPAIKYVSAIARQNVTNLGGWTGWIPVPSVQPPPPPPPAVGLQTGIVTNGDNTFMDLKPKHNRSEYSLGTTAMGAKGAAEGFRVKGSLLQPLVTIPRGGMPAASSVGNSVKAWAGSGVKLVEIGNELNYSNKYGPSRSAGEAYGRIIKACCEALTPAGIGVLAIGEDGGEHNNAFLEGMLAAVPNLVDLLAKGKGGLTIHPYWGTGTYGAEKMDRMVAFWEKHGGNSLPIYATEWGIPSDNGVALTAGGKPTGQKATYQQAGEVITKDPGVLMAHAKGKLASLFLYQTHDQKAPHATTDREAYFGARKMDGSRKGYMSDAADSFLAASV